MGSYGLKIAPRGIGVKTAKDTELVFSSSFKTLQIAKEGIVDAKDKGTDGSFRTIKHGLGFRPAFIVFNITKESEVKREVFESGASFIGHFMSVDEKNIYYENGADDSDGLNEKLYYYIFNLDLDEPIFGEKDPDTKSKEADFLSKTNSYGLKVAKENRNINTKSSERLSFSSQYKSFIIHSLMTIKSPATVVRNKFFYDLDYTPMVFSYYEMDSTDPKFVKHTGNILPIPNVGDNTTKIYPNYVSISASDRVSKLYCLIFKSLGI